MISKLVFKGTLSTLGLGAMMLIACSSLRAEDANKRKPHSAQPAAKADTRSGTPTDDHPVVRDPINHNLADGSMQAVPLNPSTIFSVEGGPAVVTEIRAINELPAGSFPPRLVAWREVEVNGEQARGFADVAAESLVTRGILKNPGPFTLRVTLATAAGDQAFILEPGLGLMVGTVSSATHKKGCSCTCSGPIGTTPINITLDCPAATPPSTNTCDCSQYNGMSCQRGSGAFGTSGGCGVALIEGEPGEQ